MKRWQALCVRLTSQPLHKQSTQKPDEHCFDPALLATIHRTRYVPYGTSLDCGEFNSIVYNKFRSTKLNIQGRPCKAADPYIHRERLAVLNFDLYRIISSRLVSYPNPSYNHIITPRSFLLYACSAVQCSAV
mmetsp:Transcript_573/g.1068  ORF Transcript_573/g.1068 Transcript_573/m.1068 type:complete len:132 (+) Transcript_573:86-481(+)